jgi:hypothetical protein
MSDSQGCMLLRQKPVAAGTQGSGCFWLVIDLENPIRNCYRLIER